MTEEKKTGTKGEEAIEDSIEQADINDEEDDEIEIQSDEEDDEDYNYQEDQVGNELYDSKLDDVNEVLLLRDALTSMETMNTQMY